MIIVTAYTLIALAMTYPLALNLTTAIPGVEGDMPSFVWAMGWLKLALERGISPFRSALVFYPLGGATQLMWATSLVALASLPWQYLFGLIATFNLFYLAATVLTAYGTYLLAQDLLRHSPFATRTPPITAPPRPPFQTLLGVHFTTQRWLASRASSLAPFVAGLVFAFAPLRLGYGLAFFNLLNTQLIPFYILFLFRASRQQSWRDAAIAGVLLGLNAYLDFQIVAFLILLTAVFVMYDWGIRWQEPTSASFLARFRAALKRTLVPAALTGLVSLVVVAPMLAILVNDFTVEGGNYLRVFPLKYSTDRSYDLLAYVVPNAWSSLYASAPKIPGVNGGTHPGDASALSPDRQAFVGYVALGLAIYATITQGRRTRFWWLTAILFALFSFGPSLHLLGQDLGVPMPYRLLHTIPILNHIRIPMRYGMMVMLAVAILAAFAINELARRLPTRPTDAHFILLLLPLAIVIEYANVPYPLQSFSIPHVYQILAQQPGDFTLLEIPSFHWRYAAATEVYQAIHGKRLLRAYTNRIAPALNEYAGLRGTPIVVRSLRILEGSEAGELTPQDIAEDVRARDAIVHFFDLRYVVVHRDLLDAEQARAIEAYLREVLEAREWMVDGKLVLYEIPRARQGSDRIRIDLRENLGQLYAGRGWQFEYPPANYDGKFNFVYARGAVSEIYFVVDRPTERTLTLNAFADPPQRSHVFLNGVWIGTLDLNATWQDYRLTLPASAMQVGMNRIELRYAAELQETIGVTTLTIE